MVNEFGAVYGDEFHSAPVITPTVYRKESAKFDIKFSPDIDDETKDNIGCIYQVEWRIGDEGESEWNKKDVVSTTIELDGLLPDTKFGIRCRKKLTESIVSDISPICWFNANDQEYQS